MSPDPKTHPEAPAPAPALHFVHAREAAPRLLDHNIWERALSLDAFIAQAEKHRDLWQTTRRLARVNEPSVRDANAISQHVRVLVLLEDWCGDAIYTVPLVARLIEQNPHIELRVASRDRHDELMAQHLTGTSRSIPVVIAYDAQGQERGWWGPRPSPLQQWVLSEGLEMDSADRYKAIRTWYARDRGATTVREVLHLLTHTASTAG
jgi:hypothetical protein